MVVVMVCVSGVGDSNGSGNPGGGVELMVVVV